MTVETALYPSQFNTTLPTAADMVSEGDDHLRLIKTVDKTTWSNVAGAVLASHIELNYVVGVTGPLQSQINAKGAINGQTWTGAHVFSGTVAVPTLAQGTNTTGAASSAFVQNEWTTRLPNYSGPITASTTELNRLVGVNAGVQSQIDGKGAISGQTWSGTHVFPSTTSIGNVSAAEISYLDNVTGPIQTQIDGKASKSGDTYTGSHNFNSATITVPTLATGSAGNNAASLDFVNATSFATSLPGQAGNAGKFVTTNGTNASWAWPVPNPVPISTNTAALPGNYYIFTAAVVLTLPANPAVNDWIGFASGRNVTGGQVNVNGRPVKGRAPTGGVIDLLSNNDAVVIYYANNTDGWVQL